MAATTAPFSIDAAPEVFFSDTAASYAIAYAGKTGRARKLGPRLYTTTMVGNEVDVTRRNWAAIAAGYFPGAVIIGRTALDPRPAAEDGSVFLTAPSLNPVGYRGWHGDRDHRRRPAGAADCGAGR